MTTEWETAVKRGDRDAVEKLIDLGSDVDSRDRYGQTALMLAANRGYRGVVETLVEHGADLNVTAKFGLSALMLAVISRHTDIARILARAGADLSFKGTGAPGFADKTACDLALAGGMLELATELKVGP